jgi:hypothetical protein
MTTATAAHRWSIHPRSVVRSRSSPHRTPQASCPPIACPFVAVQEPGIGTEGRWAENVSSAVLLTSTFSANAHGMHRGTDQKGQTGDILG